MYINFEMESKSENEIPPWGARFEPDKNGHFRMTERSSSRKYKLDEEAIDHFRDYLDELYAKLIKIGSEL